GSYLWRNQTALVSTQQSSTSDVGAWRLEVTAPAAPAMNAPEYFLHVLAVADNDGATAPAGAPAAVRLAATGATRLPRNSTNKMEFAFAPMAERPGSDPEGPTPGFALGVN
ncbi:MAG: hypothetical protein RR376_28570, partial [Janthinobacterium sp.]